MMVGAVDFTIRQGDLLPVYRGTVIDDEGKVVDLTASNQIFFRMVTLDRLTVKVNQDAVVIGDAANGRVEYAWVLGDTDTEAMYFAEIHVLWGDGRPETFPNTTSPRIIQVTKKTHVDF